MIGPEADDHASTAGRGPSRSIAGLGRSPIAQRAAGVVGNGAGLGAQTIVGPADVLPVVAVLGRARTIGRSKRPPLDRGLDAHRAQHGAASPRRRDASRDDGASKSASRGCRVPAARAKESRSEADIRPLATVCWTLWNTRLDVSCFRSSAPARVSMTRSSDPARPQPAMRMGPGDGRMN